MKKILLVMVILSFFSLEAHAGVKSEEIKYKIDGNEFTGYLVFDDAISGKRPGILVVHEWWGHNAYSRKRAEMLAALGYTAFALDMYGTGKLADHPKDAKAFMQAAVGKLPEAEKRFKAAYQILLDHATVDQQNIAAIGYCLGGGIVLHMARTGVTDLAGVVSYHGSFQFATQTPSVPGRAKAKVLAFTGGADPFVPPKHVQAFVKSMNEAGVDFELKSYPGVKHSFTVPGADQVGKKVGLPMVYNQAADKDSWQRTQQFLNGIFND